MSAMMREATRGGVQRAFSGVSRGWGGGNKHGGLVAPLSRKDIGQHGDAVTWWRMGCSSMTGVVRVSERRACSAWASFKEEVWGTFVECSFD